MQGQTDFTFVISRDREGFFGYVAELPIINFRGMEEVSLRTDLSNALKKALELDKVFDGEILA